MSWLEKMQLKIVNLAELKRRVSKWKEEKSIVVFTNGCFDILHPGHITYLAQAKDLGHKLIVGLNSDKSVKLLNKGANRPLQTEQARAINLSALAFVDAIVIFDEETPIKLIEAIDPSVLVKGGDYTPDTVVGASHVTKKKGKVVLLPFVQGYSTSAIEQKIKQS
jgi:rfaE bifunctional protein nucleotidyltransferase chain/domain